MRVNELYSQVAQLGFGTSLDDGNERFYYALNRALLQVNLIRPAVKACIINHFCVPNLLSEDTTKVIQITEDTFYEAENAKAYTFFAMGQGNLYIENFANNTWKTIHFEEINSRNVFKNYKGFIKDDGEFVKGTVRIRFDGEYIFYVKNIALYEYIVSGNVDDIKPFDTYIEYDLNKITTDFLSFNMPPIEQSEYNILSEKYMIQGNNIILFSNDIQGSFKVLYNKKPTEIVYSDPLTDETVVDLDDELCSLLPNLIAAYVWAEDEPNLSEYYLSLYRERVLQVQSNIKNITPIKIYSENGW